MDYFVGVNMVPGESQVHTPHRAELSGIAGGLTLLKMVCNVYSISAGKVTIGLDGKNALRRAREDSEMASFADWDLIKVIHTLLAELPTEYDWRWIEGHQDDTRDLSELDDWARRNIMMDGTAKQFWHHCQDMGLTPYKGWLYGERWAIKWNKRKLANFHVRAIYDEHKGDEICEEWVDRSQFKPTAAHLIDWKSMERAVKLMPFQRRTWMTKFISGYIGVNRWRHKWNQTGYNACPICLNPNETSTHVLNCQDPRVKSQWHISVTKLALFLEKQNTPEDIKNTIVQRLLHWRDPEYMMKGDQVQCLVEAQEKIGWNNLLFGRLDTKWIEYHASIVISKENHKSKRWVSALIRKLLEIAWDLWEHRNGIAHAPNHPWKDEERGVLAVEIKQQFNMGTTTLLPRDRSKLSMAPEDILKLSDDLQRQWVASMLAARECYRHQTDINQDLNSRPAVLRMRTELAGWLNGGN